MGRWGLAFLVFATVFFFRGVPHLANFSPLLAVVLFLGTRPQWSTVGAAFLAFLITDLILGFSDFSQIFVYAAYAAILLLGFSMGNRRPWRLALVGGLGSVALFFIVTNFGVWLFSGMYEHSWAGLLRCYALAIPFLKPTLGPTLLGALALVLVMRQYQMAHGETPISGQ